MAVYNPGNCVNGTGVNDGGVAYGGLDVVPKHPQTVNKRSGKTKRIVKTSMVEIAITNSSGLEATVD